MFFRSVFLQKRIKIGIFFDFKCFLLVSTFLFWHLVVLLSLCLSNPNNQTRIFEIISSRCVIEVSRSDFPAVSFRKCNLSELSFVKSEPYRVQLFQIIFSKKLLEELNRFSLLNWQESQITELLD